MNVIFKLAILVLIITLSSCRKDFDTVLSNGTLEFSRDTIFFNRVFDNISSSTRRITIKNNSSDDITIPKITLERGNNSFYRLNIDGIEGKIFNNIDILAKDSIYVFAEVTVDFSQVTDLNFMYKDEILFDGGLNQQKVSLESLVLDVNLIRPNRTAIENGFDYEEIILATDTQGNNLTIRGTNLLEDTTWQNSKPYLIYGYVGVPTGKTLTIEAGTRLYFHQNSGIIVQEGASLIVNGEQSTTEEFENQVIFQGDRLEEEYAEVSGQWGTIWLREGSVNTQLNHTTIKNATIGLLVDSNITTAAETLAVNNTQVYNTTSFGILARNAKITAKNMVVANNGKASFSAMLGGTYNFYHTTMANYWRNSNRQNPTLMISDVFETQTTIFTADLQANFTNCIIYGSQNIEYSLENKETTTTFDHAFKNCVIKFIDTNNQYANNPLYDFNNTTNYQNNTYNQNPNFYNTDTTEGKMELIIGENSSANTQADTSVLTDIILQKDILGVDRVAPTDIGAYQHITFQ